MFLCYLIIDNLTDKLDFFQKSYIFAFVFDIFFRGTKFFYFFFYTNRSRRCQKKAYKKCNFRIRRSEKPYFFTLFPNENTRKNLSQFSYQNRSDQKLYPDDLLKIDRVADIRRFYLLVNLY